MTTEERINKLAAERSQLYSVAANGRRGKSSIMQRIHEISSEIEALWEQRRQERAGLREGIDRLVDGVYERTYGRDFEDAIAPPPVAEAEDAKRGGVATVIAA